MRKKKKKFLQPISGAIIFTKVLRRDDKRLISFCYVKPVWSVGTYPTKIEGDDQLRV